MLDNKGIMQNTTKDSIDSIYIDESNINEYNLPSRRDGNYGFLRFLKRNNDVISIFIDSRNRTFIHEKISLNNNEHPKDRLQEDKWRRLAVDTFNILRESDIKGNINKKGVNYNPKDVENKINNKALASQYDDYFKRDEENRAVDGHTLNIPRVEMYWQGIYMVKDKKPNTSYAIYYRTPQSNQVSIFAHWYRSGNDTPIFIGNFKNENHEDILIRQHDYRPNFISPGNNKGLVMSLDTTWRHYGNHGSGFTIGLPGGSRDVFINPNGRLVGYRNSFGPDGRNFGCLYWPAYKNMVYDNQFSEGWVNTARQLHFSYTTFTYIIDHWYGRHLSHYEREEKERAYTITYHTEGDTSFGVWWRGE